MSDWVKESKVQNLLAHYNLTVKHPKVLREALEQIVKAHINKAKVCQSGGDGAMGHTVMPLQYFGQENGSYSADNASAHTDMSATAELARPPLSQHGGALPRLVSISSVAKVLKPSVARDVAKKINAHVHSFMQEAAGLIKTEAKVLGNSHIEKALRAMRKA